MLTPDEVLKLVKEAADAVGILQSHIEARDFAVWCSEREIANVLELGTCSGGMMFLMDRACKPGVRISMDMPWSVRDPKPPQNWESRFRSYLPHVIEVFGQIHDEAQRNQLATVLGDKKLDLIFIDADHSAEGAAQHVRMYAPFLRPGGYLAFHDLSNGWACGTWVKENLFPMCPHWLFEEPKNLYGIGVIQI
jgi:predicted O-methyltransferase YrrM